MDGIVDATTPGGGETQDYLLTGLAVGIPCGIIIIVLVIVIGVMICFTLSSPRNRDEVEAMYVRRRFQGLSLEEQRRRQRSDKSRNKFISRRRSSAAGESSCDQLHPLTRSGKVRAANPFGLQEWQLKLSGIVTMVDGDTEETDVEESPRSPLGAVNPILFQFPQDEVQASYEAVYRPQVSEGDEEFYPIRSYQAVVTNSEGNTSDSNSSEDSFNPYD